MRLLTVLAALLAAPLTLAAAAPAVTLTQLLDYVAVDYSEAVADGRVIDSAEYAEMQEFGAVIAATAAELPAHDNQARLIEQAAQLRALVDARADTAEIRALAGAMRSQVLADFRIDAVPARAPDAARGAALYAEGCAFCHGATGAGDGPAGAGLQPAPTNFLDAGRARQRSLFGLYSTIGAGVEGTSMPSFAHLPEADRWALAFHVGRLAFAPATGAGALSLTELVTRTPAELEGAHGAAGLAEAVAFRHDPAARFAAAPAAGDPVGFALTELDASLAEFEAGDRDGAYRRALGAYLEGFELAEAALDTVDGALRQRTEQSMLRYRDALKTGEAAQVRSLHAEARAALAAAQERLAGDRVQGATAFVASFVILLREGLEALLVVTALLAFLLKTGRREGLPYLHAGWIGALALGLALGYASERYLVISGAQREVAEGVAALVAAAVMLGVGLWMHSRSHAAEWQRYIAQSMQTVLSRSSLWGLAGLSFIAVFRECFETILFYQALWAQTDEAGRQMTFLGMGAAAAVLLVVSVLVLRYSARLPLRPFFAAMGVMLLALAIVFAGKGVVALQEAGVVPGLGFDGPTLSWIGVYPDAYALGLQLLIAAIGAFMLLRKPAPSPAPR